MDGFHGYRGWRWIFILEGILTCLVAVLLYFCIPGFPEDAKWLTTDEREYIRARIAFDQGSCGSEKRLAFSDVISLFKDPKTIVGGCMYFGLSRLILVSWMQVYKSSSRLT